MCRESNGTNEQMTNEKHKKTPNETHDELGQLLMSLSSKRA